jgi:hypothetical protein
MPQYKITWDCPNTEEERSRVDNYDDAEQASGHGYSLADKSYYRVYERVKFIAGGEIRGKWSRITTHN